MWKAWMCLGMMLACIYLSGWGLSMDGKVWWAIPTWISGIAGVVIFFIMSVMCFGAAIVDKKKEQG